MYVAANLLINQEIIIVRTIRHKIMLWWFPSAQSTFVFLFWSYLCWSTFLIEHIKNTFCCCNVKMFWPLKLHVQRFQWISNGNQVGEADCEQKTFTYRLSLSTLKVDFSFHFSQPTHMPHSQFLRLFIWKIFTT